MKKPPKKKYSFVVEMLDDDIKFIFINKREGDLIHQALLRCTFPHKVLHQEKELTMEYDKLSCKIEEQLGIL